MALFLTLNPNNAISFGNRGLAYTNLGEYQKAINNYEAKPRLAKDIASFGLRVIA
jgi:regulator of sirC expression with transglutaminase-like and TPR domain